MSLIIFIAKGINNLYGAGNYKDLKSLNLLLEEQKIEYDLLELDLAKSEQDLNVQKIINFSPNILICHYSHWTPLLMRLKSALPKLKIFTRTHNAEAFQHWQRSEVSLKPTYENLRNIYGSVMLYAQDINCRQCSDYLLGISEWDNQNYWRYMPGKAQIMYTPYHCPWPELRPHVLPQHWEKRNNCIVCLPGGRDRFGRSQISNFTNFARQVSQISDYSSWSYAISPGVHKNDSQSSDIKPLTLLETLTEPWDLLCSVKALAFLTPFGFGTKTTIIDALTAGCHVLVDKTLAQRLDPHVKPFCLVIDPTDPKTMIDAMAKIQLPPSQNNINSCLRTKAINSLKNLFSQNSIKQ